MNIAEKISKDSGTNNHQNSAVETESNQPFKDNYLDELSFLNKRPCWQASSRQK